MLFYFLKFPTSRTMKATTDAWIALEDEEDAEEKGGDDDAMRALFEEEQDEEETDVEFDSMKLSSAETEKSHLSQTPHWILDM